jgi:hypothetical protein
MQYKVLEADTPINEQQLEELAIDGWHLVEILPYQDIFYFYFKRELWPDQ